MMDNTHVPCGPCAYKNLRKKSMVWCPACGEGLCDNCLLHHRASAASRKHNVVVKDLHRVPSVLYSLRQTCIQHSLTFDLYCDEHEVPLCSKCMGEHKKCLRILPINYVSRNSKFSTKIWDIENGIAHILGNIEEITKKKEDNLDSIKDEKESIELEISNLRKKINDYLDSLQDRVLKDISAIYSKVSRDTASFMSRIGKRKQNIQNIAENIACIREYASDLQTFLLTKKLEIDYSREHESFISDLSDSDLEEVDIHVNFNSNIYSTLASVTRLADIDVIRHKSTLTKIKKDMEDDRVPNNVSPLANIRLLSRIPITTPRDPKTKFLRNCVVLENKEIIFTDDSENKRLVWFHADGSHKKNIEMRSEPYDIINHDANKVAVTVPREKAIFMFDLTKNKITGRILTKNYCYGLCFYDKKFIVSVLDKGIQTLDAYGQVLRTVSLNVEKICNIHTNFDRLFFTEYDTSTVTCCDLYGNCIWKFRNKGFAGPLSLSTDKTGNVYAIGYDTDNLIVISADGKSHTTLLEGKDKLFGPTALFLHKSKQLLVCCRFDGQAVLYDLVT